MVWEQLDVTKAHVAYACVGVFSISFSLISYIVKEKLYTGEATAATIFGLIVGPHCLDWFNPQKWGNLDDITLELSRIVLCIQIFATAVELPKKYMLKHWVSVFMLLVPVMTAGWLIVGSFIYLVMPGFSFPDGLLVSACITATDPILSQSIVAGAFAQTHVPKHLRNLISAESGCNDGMAFPFIYLSLNLIVHKGNGGEIVKDWICVTLLYECVLGCFMGVVIGYCGRHLIKYCETHNYIDRVSFLAFYIILAITCAGFGSILGVDDLLVSFAAGAAFAWDGWFSKKTHETHISTVIDLLLNYSYFIYFGSIIPWSEFNSHEYGLDVWRLIVLSIVIIFLRRLPAVMTFWRLIPDIKSVREALFVGWFGSIGVGAIFASILARSELEHYSLHTDETPLKELPSPSSKYYRLIFTIWPLVTFFVVTSIIVHGSSVAVMMLGKHLNTITLTKTFTAHTTNGGNKGPSWMQRLPELNSDENKTVSLQRIDTLAPSSLKDEKFFLSDDQLSKVPTIENGAAIGISSSYLTTDNEGNLEYNEIQNKLFKTNSNLKEKAKPIGGAKRKKKDGKAIKRLKKFTRKRQEFFGQETDVDKQHTKLDQEREKREKEAQAASFALGSVSKNNISQKVNDTKSEETEENYYSEVQTGSQSTENQHHPQHLGDDNALYPSSDLEAEYPEYDYDEDEVYNTHNQHKFRDEDNNPDMEYNYSDEGYEDGAPLKEKGQNSSLQDSHDLADESVNHMDRLATHISNTGYTNEPEISLDQNLGNQETSDQLLQPVSKEEALKRIYSLTQDSGNVVYATGDHIVVENQDGDVIVQAELHHDADSAKSNDNQKDDSKLKPIRSNGSAVSKFSRVLSDGATNLKKALSGESILSNEENVTKERKKYYAYRVDTQLIIEDENGDVLRRYKIKTQDKPKKEGDIGSLVGANLDVRGRADSIMNKALNKVGLGKLTSAKKVSSKDPQSPKSQTPGTPVLSSGTATGSFGFGRSASPAPSRNFESDEDSNPDPDNDESEYENDVENNSDDGDEDEDEDEDDDEDESGNEEETDIERYRRLAAQNHQGA